MKCFTPRKQQCAGGLRNVSDSQSHCCFLRRWVDAEGKFLTQRPGEPRQGNKGKGIPAMATIDVSITADGTTLRLAAEGCEPLEVETTAGPGATRRECTLFR